MQPNLNIKGKIMQKFTENEIPYEDFERMGFSQEMIDDLPEGIMNRLLSGEKTPLLSSSKNDNYGNPMKATIWMSREENGVVTAFYRPYDNVRDYSDFSKSQQKTLLSGGVVLTELKGQPSSYYQMDEETNRILSCPADCLKSNFQGLKESISDVDEEAFISGRVQTVVNGDKSVTIGIDLSDSKGYRVVKGNEENWKQEKETDKLPKYNFGLYGCWTVDNDNNLSYVSEDKYTDDMVKAQNELVERNKARGMHM